MSGDPSLTVTCTLVDRALRRTVYQPCVLVGAAWIQTMSTMRCGTLVVTVTLHDMQTEALCGIALINCISQCECGTHVPPSRDPNPRTHAETPLQVATRVQAQVFLEMTARCTTALQCCCRSTRGDPTHWLCLLCGHGDTPPKRKRTLLPDKHGSTLWVQSSTWVRLVSAVVRCSASPCACRSSEAWKILL